MTPTKKIFDYKGLNMIPFYIMVVGRKMVTIKKDIVVGFLGDVLEKVKELNSQGYNGFLIGQLTATVWELRAWKRKV